MIARPSLSPRVRGGLLVAVAVLVIAAVSLVIVRSGASSGREISAPQGGFDAADPAITLKLPSPDLLRPISPEEAVEENRNRAFSDRPDSPASAFVLETDALSRNRALECLAQAVYYEAASEGLDGGKAVAQVVLNRMRHPAYPASVCGVVYQGSERVTGCQFTFTCDGSLARIPARALWQQAQRIALEALAGRVYAPVGHATHYHADYVLPYWADSLDKSVQIGRHIFYRLKGGLGAKSFFRQRYAGREPLPPPPPLPTTTEESPIDTIIEADDPLSGAPANTTDSLLARNGDLIAAEKPKRDPLLADSLSGSLIADGDSAPSAVSRRSDPADCSAGERSRKLRPMAPDDLRGRTSQGDC